MRISDWSSDVCSADLDRPLKDSGCLEQDPVASWASPGSRYRPAHIAAPARLSIWQSTDHCRHWAARDDSESTHHKSLRFPGCVSAVPGLQSFEIGRAHV